MPLPTEKSLILPLLLKDFSLARLRKFSLPFPTEKSLILPLLPERFLIYSPLRKSLFPSN